MPKTYDLKRRSIWLILKDGKDQTGNYVLRAMDHKGGQKVATWSRDNTGDDTPESEDDVDPQEAARFGIGMGLVVLKQSLYRALPPGETPSSAVESRYVFVEGVEDEQEDDTIEFVDMWVEKHPYPAVEDLPFHTQRPLSTAALALSGLTMESAKNSQLKKEGGSD